MNDVLQRLKDRKLVQWALAYVAAAFALIQVLDIVAQRFGWPLQAMRFVIIALSVGFLASLILAWYHGERGAQRVSGTELLMLALLLAIGGAVAWRLAPTVEQAPASGADTAKSVAAVEPATDRKSIAVLAFTDLSPAKDHEYLSDGIAEEVLNALTRVPGLKVAGRTSSFHYKGRNEDLREIGRALEVAHVLEGSVRTQDDKVRITAQLIRTADGFHLWSDSYDGQLTDVFDLEDRIARKIVRELDVLLKAEDSARMVEVATTSAEAYALYLRATDVFNRREGSRYQEAIGWLDQAVQLDQKFARAYALRASLRMYGADWATDLGAAEGDARRALELDPKLAQAHLALSRLYFFNQQVSAQAAVHLRDEIEQAVALGPDDADINFTYAQNLLQQGYVKRGNERLERTLAIDPLLPNALFWRGFQHLMASRLSAAESDLKRAVEVGLNSAERGLFDLAQAKGDYAAAEKLLPVILALDEGLCGGVRWRDAPLAIQVGRPGTAAERAAAEALIERCLATKPDPVPFWVLSTLIRLDQPERALAAAMTARVQNFSGLLWRLWAPSKPGLRAAPNFLDYARKVGLVDIWEKYGAPDACQRTAPRRYTCS